MAEEDTSTFRKHQSDDDRNPSVLPCATGTPIRRNVSIPGRSSPAKSSLSMDAPSDESHHHHYQRTKRNKPRRPSSRRKKNGVASTLAKSVVQTVDRMADYVGNAIFPDNLHGEDSVLSSQDDPSEHSRATTVVVLPFQCDAPHKTLVDALTCAASTCQVHEEHKVAKEHNNIPKIVPEQQPRHEPSTPKKQRDSPLAPSPKSVAQDLDDLDSILAELAAEEEHASRIMGESIIHKEVLQAESQARNGETQELDEVAFLQDSTAVSVSVDKSAKRNHSILDDESHALDKSAKSNHSILDDDSHANDEAPGVLMYEDNQSHSEHDEPSRKILESFIQEPGEKVQDSLPTKEPTEKMGKSPINNNDPAKPPVPIDRDFSIQFGTAKISVLTIAQSSVAGPHSMVCTDFLEASHQFLEDAKEPFLVVLDSLKVAKKQATKAPEPENDPLGIAVEVSLCPSSGSESTRVEEEPTDTLQKGNDDDKFQDNVVPQKEEFEMILQQQESVEEKKAMLQQQAPQKVKNTFRSSPPKKEKKNHRRKSIFQKRFKSKSPAHVPHRQAGDGAVLRCETSKHPTLDTAGLDQAKSCRQDPESDTIDAAEDAKSIWLKDFQDWDSGSIEWKTECVSSM